MKMKIDASDFKKKHKSIMDKMPDLIAQAQGAMVVQLANNIATGGGKINLTPQVKTGFLRRSWAAEAGGKTYGMGADGTPQGGTTQETATLAFTASYAAITHDDFKPYGPRKLGPVSVQSGNAGPKYLALHVERDHDELMEFLGAYIKRRLK